MLTGGAMTGAEAAAIGWANRAFPADELEEEVLDVAATVAGVATDLAQINKRMVHRQAEIMGVRAAIRAETDRLGWSFTIHRTDRPTNELLLALHARIGEGNEAALISRRPHGAPTGRSASVGRPA